MKPTLNENSIIVIDKFFFKYFDRWKIKQNDIVVAVQPVDLKTLICKRATKLSGDEIIHGLKVPENYYWLVGDNPRMSFDSRHHGCVPGYLVTGKVIFHFDL